MKYIVRLILVLVFIANSSNYKINVANVDDEQVDETLVALMEDLKPFIEKPLNWCEIKPTGEFVVMEKGPIYSRVRIQMNATCDESETRQKFREFWFKYRNFLHDHGDRVDDAIECMYPDYELTWGESINSYQFLKLGIRTVYGGTGSFHDKSLFFRLQINEEYLTDPMRLEMQGSTLKLIATNTLPDRLTSDAWFVFVIPTKLIKSNEFNVDVQRQWHLSAHEKFIKNTLY